MSLTPLGSGWHARIARVLDELGVTEPARAAIAIPQLARLLDLVVDWNARTDLTAARDADELVDLFVADAALLARESRLLRKSSEAEHWIDVGSGAGAPALGVAILRPELEVTLVEPRAKRVAFLRTAIGALELERVRVERGRAETLRLPTFAVATSRATLPPAKWLELGAKLGASVWVLLAKGLPPSLDGWQVAADVAYRWPLSGSDRRALCFVKSSREP